MELVKARERGAWLASHLTQRRRSLASVEGTYLRSRETGGGGGKSSQLEAGQGRPREAKGGQGRPRELMERPERSRELMGAHESSSADGMGAQGTHSVSPPKAMQSSGGAPVQRGPVPLGPSPHVVVASQLRKAASYLRMQRTLSTACSVLRWGAGEARVGGCGRGFCHDGGLRMASGVRWNGFWGSVEWRLGERVPGFCGRGEGAEGGAPYCARMTAVCGPSDCSGQ